MEYFPIDRLLLTPFQSIISRIETQTLLQMNITPEHQSLINNYYSISEELEKIGRDFQTLEKEEGKLRNELTTLGHLVENGAVSHVATTKIPKTSTMIV